MPQSPSSGAAGERRTHPPRRPEARAAPSGSSGAPARVERAVGGQASAGPPRRRRLDRAAVDELGVVVEGRRDVEVVRRRTSRSRAAEAYASRRRRARSQQDRGQLGIALGPPGRGDQQLLARGQVERVSEARERDDSARQVREESTCSGSFLRRDGRVAPRPRQPVDLGRRRRPAHSARRCSRYARSAARRIRGRQRVGAGRCHGATVRPSARRPCRPQHDLARPAGVADGTVIVTCVGRERT